MEGNGWDDVGGGKRNLYHLSLRTVILMVMIVGLMVVPGLAIESNGTGTGAGANNGGGFDKRTKPPGEAKYKEGEILVKFKAHVVEDDKHRTHAKHGAHKIREFKSIGVHHVKLKKGMSVEEAIKLYQSDPDVEYAEPNYTFQLNATPIYPNDPAWLDAYLNAPEPKGSFSPRPDLEDAHLPEAWSITTGSNDVVMAVLDTSVWYEHPDLMANIWVNDRPGIEVDGIQIVNDVHGYDPGKQVGISSLPTTPPAYDYGHGTAVAGTIGAVGNNGIGIAGVNWNVKIMLCTVADDLGGVSSDAVILCLDYVKAQKYRGVNIVATNNSYGAYETFAYGHSVHDAIAAQKDILYINSAGNSGAFGGCKNNDICPNSPGDDLPNYIGVTGTSQEYNYGLNTVHVAAPVASMTLDKYGAYAGEAWGTSFAAPFVTGLAALIKANNPAYDGWAIRNLILTGGDDVDYFADKTVTGKKINAYNSLNCIDRPLFRVLQASSAITIGVPTTIKVLSLNCAAPAGPVFLNFSDNTSIELTNNGEGPDLIQKVGMFYGTWTPTKDLEILSISGPGGMSRSLTTYTIPAVMTTSLPRATATVEYTQTLQGGSGTPPYTWTWSGTLPDGLSLNSETGVISGTPTKPGLYSFNITITDTQSHSAVKGLSLDVLDPRISQDQIINDPDSNYHISSATEIVADSKGNIYVGVTRQDNDGNGILSDSNLVVKYDASGNFVWSRKHDNVMNNDNVHIAIDHNDSIVTTNNLTDGSFDVSKYDETGSLVWSKNSSTLGTANLGTAQGIGIDAAGNVYVKAYDPTNGQTIITLDPTSGNILPPTPISVAQFDRMAVDKDGTIVGTGVLNSSSYRITAYHPSGSVKWMEDVSTQSANGAVVTTDDNGNVYVAGGYNNGGYVVAKYSTDGTQKWSHYKSDYIYYNLKPLGISVDLDGTMYISFGNSCRQNYTLAYDTDGTLLWDRRYEGADLPAITSDNLNHVYLAGTGFSNIYPNYLIVKYTDNKYQIISKNIPTGYKTKPYSTKILSAGGGASVIWSVASGRLPNGLALTSDTGIISGIPSETGNFGFTLQIVNASGATASRAFILTILPEINITSPETTTYNKTPMLKYTAIDGTVAVKVDGMVVNKVSGDTLDVLPDGLHTVRVELTDTNLYSEVSFTLDTIKPTVIIKSPTTGVTTDGNPILSYAVSEGTTVITVDGKVVPLLSGDTLGQLTVGPHTVRVEATDLASNSSFAEVKFTIADFINEEWSRQYSGPVYVNGTSGTGVAVDVNGNVYATGKIVTEQYPRGVIATMKYDSTGNELWSRTYYDPLWYAPSNPMASIGPGGVAVDGTGNVYISGYGATPDGDFKPFIVKYDPYGNEIWTTDESGGKSIALDKNGNIYSTGTYSQRFFKTSVDGGTPILSKPLEFQPSAIAVDPNNNILITGGPQQIVKYDPDGTRLWSQTYNYSFWGEVTSTAIAADLAGNAYVTGQIITNLNPYKSAFFTTKYDSAGNVLWTSTSESENGSKKAYGIALDGSGGIYVTGFSPGSLVKYDSDGNTIWTRNGIENGYAIAVDNNGYAYVTGLGFHIIKYQDTLYSVLRVITPSLTPGTVGTSYSKSLVATGGTKLYTWSISAGFLPAGLQLNSATGVISGTPTAAGRFAFTAQVTDANGATASRDFTATIYEPVAITSPTNGFTNISRPVLTYIGTTGKDETVVVKVDGFVVNKVSGDTLDILNDGLHKVKVEATNTAGYTRFAEVSFTVDSIAPTVTITSPLNGLTNNNTPLLSYIVNDGSTIVSVDGVVVNLVTGNTLGPFADGTTRTVRVQATDTAGNSSFAEVVFTFRGFLSEEWRRSVELTSGFGGKITVDNNENVYVASQIMNGGNIDFLVIKYDASGNVAWRKTYDNNSVTGSASGIVVDNEGNIYVNGGIGNNISILLKFDAAGNVLWSRNYDGYSANGIGLDIQGNIHVASTTTTGLRVVKYASNGDELLNTEYTGQFSATSMALDMTDNVYLFGQTYTGTEYDYTLVKFLSTGVVEWAKTYSWGWVDWAGAVAIGKDGNVYTTGYSRNQAEYYKMHTQIFAPSGQLLWTGRYPDGTDKGFGRAIYVDDDGSFYVGGASGLRTTSGDMNLVKYDASGNVVWSQSEDFGFEYSIYGITSAKSGNVYAIGDANTGGKNVIIKYKQFVISTSAQQVATAGPYSLTLSASNGQAPYSWSITDALPDGLMFDSATGVISGTLATAGTNSFTVQVTDTNGLTVKKIITITGYDPIFIPTPPATPCYVGTFCSIPLTATGGKTTYTWSIAAGTLPVGLTLNPTTGLISGTPTIAGTSNITVQLVDANSTTTAQSFSIATYDALNITTVSLADGYLTTTYSQTLVITGGLAPYSWSITSGTLPAGLSLDVLTGAVSGTPTTAGTSNFTVHLVDANSTTTTQSFSIATYDALNITTGSLADGYVGSAYNQNLAATGGKSPYTWSITSGTLPVGLTLNASTGAITGTLTAAGISSITFQVTDANNITDSKSVSITVNAAMSVNIVSMADGYVGSAYNQTLAVTGGKSPYTWSIATGTLPTGLSLNTSTGAITGTPAAAGTSSITFQVTDANNITDSKSVSITVNAALSVTTASLTDGYVGSAYNQTLAAIGGKSPYTCSITSGTLPAGLSLNAFLGAITGTPTAAGTSSITVQVADTNNAMATKSLTLTTYAMLSISTTSLSTGTAGAAYSQTLAATGGKTAYTWSIASGTLSSGLSLNATTGVISGTPTTAGTSNFTVQVADANGKTATNALSITIVAPEVSQLNAWTNLYSAAPNNTSATNLAAGSFTVGSGSNRLLLVSVVMEIGTAGNPIISATYGGTALTELKVTNNTQREIVWVGYLKESQIGSVAKALAITYSGATGNVSALHVKWTAFSGVNQTTPVVSSGATNTNTTSATFGSTINYVANGMTTVVAGNGGTPATGALSATPAFTAGTATTTNAQTSNTFTTAKHTANGNYSSSIAVNWSGPTSTRSGLVVVSLQP